jgi:autotransporter-associated beta strand protein
VQTPNGPIAFLQRRVLVVFIIIISTTVCSAQTWNGAGADGNWTTAQNWIGNSGPISGPNTYIHFQGTVRPSSFADTNSPWVLNRLDFETRAFTAPHSFFISGKPLSFQGASPQIYIYASAAQTIDNDVDIPGSDLTVNALTSGSLTVNGHISGAGGIAAAGSSLFLNNSNSYEGTTTIGQSPVTGSVTITNGHALGKAGAGGVIVGLGGQLRLSGGIVVDSKPLTMSSGSGFNSNGLMSVSGNNLWTGPITLSFTSAIWSLNAGDTLTVSGDLEGNNNLIQMGGTGDIFFSGAIRNLSWDLSKYGTGTLTLAGTNSNIYQIVVGDGTLVAAHSSALPYDTPIQLNGNSQDAHPILRIEEDTTIGGLTGYGTGGTSTVQLGSHILTINQAFYSSYNGAFAGSGTIVKTGAGALELTAASNHTGEMVIRGGALRLGQDRALGEVPAMPKVNLIIDGGELQPSPSSVSLTLNAYRTILLQGPASVTSFASQAPLILPGRITGPGILTKVGAFGVTLSNQKNNYTGGTFINAGTLKFDDPGAIAPTGMITIGNGAIAAAGYAIDQKFLSRINPTSTGTIALAVDSAEDLDFKGPELNNVYFGAIGSQNYGGSIVAAKGGYRLGGMGMIRLTRENALRGTTSLHIGLDSSAAGRVILSANNSLNGDTIVHGGTLEVSGTILHCNQLEVRPQATLQLTGGTVETNVTVEAMGALRGCGAIAGTLTNNGSVVIDCAAGLAVTGAITNNGNMTILGGAILTAGGSFVNNGLLDLLTSPGTTLPPGFVNNGTVVYPSDVKVRSMSKSGMTFSLTVQSLTGHNYQLQRNATLGASSWQNVGSPVPGTTGRDITMIDFTVAPQQFYRVQVSP